MKTRKAAPQKNPKPLPFRWRELGDKVLLTNDAGEFCWLAGQEFEQFLAGKLAQGSAAAQTLAQAHFFRDETSQRAVQEKLARRSSHLFSGPGLHIVILTLRCDQACVYCHASRKPRQTVGFDMSRETAERVLEVIFQGPAEELTIEFQGGEPTLNFEILSWMVEDARRRAERLGRTIYFSLVSNLAGLEDRQVDFLVDNGVMVCTSIDGPEKLHDRNRKYAGRSSHAAALAGIERFKAAYQKRGLDTSLAYVNALATVSRASLAEPQAIVDEYVRVGQKVVHLRPLNPFGMGKKIWTREGYSAVQFLDFYRRALHYMVDLNRRGVEIMEKTAALFLTRILTDRNPNYMDLRSPCGAGIGQLAYNYDGKVYTCDEGRMVAAMGDDIFCVGDVHRDDYGAIISAPAVRSLCVASCLEGLPGCADCAYLPYCGVCPVYNYIMEGDLVARCPQNDRCRIQKGILDELFLLLRDPQNQKLLERWTEEKDRSSVYRKLA